MRTEALTRMVKSYRPAKIPVASIVTIFGFEGKEGEESEKERECCEFLVASGCVLDEKSHFVLTKLSTDIHEPVIEKETDDVQEDLGKGISHSIV